MEKDCRIHVEKRFPALTLHDRKKGTGYYSKPVKY